MSEIDDLYERIKDMGSELLEEIKIRAATERRVDGLMETILQLRADLAAAQERIESARKVIFAAEQTLRDLSSALDTRDDYWLIALDNSINLAAWLAEETK